MKKIGIIGAGVMGVGVSHVFAQKGYEVVLIDLSEEKLEKAKKSLIYNLRMQMLLDKDKSESYDIDAIIARIEFATDLHLLKDVELVVENVTESIEVKQSVYGAINDICSKKCIFAVNTSCIPISYIGDQVDNPSRVIGTHFMNPVHSIHAIEVIKGKLTSKETVDKIIRELNQIGKESIVVHDSPGFVSNRLSHLLMNEAALLVEENVAEPKDIDDIFKKCYGHKMGPLETADLIGIDTVVNSIEILYQFYQDSKFNCCSLLRKMVQEGHLGRKTKQGFYSYL